MFTESAPRLIQSISGDVHVSYVVCCHHPWKKCCPHMSICARTTFYGAPQYSQVVTSEYMGALLFPVFKCGL